MVDASGPFQFYGSSPYALVEGCVACGIDYLDLADGSAFVDGIRTFDERTRERGIFVLAGVSSFASKASATPERLAGIRFYAASGKLHRMADNPYAPPQAPVVTQPLTQARKPPPVIMAAIACLCATVAIYCWQSIDTWRAFTTGMVGPSTLIVIAVGLAIDGWLFWKILQGRNWARWVMAALIVLRNVRLLLSIVAVPSSMAVMLDTFAELGIWLDIAVVILLFTPPAARWFKPPSATRPGAAIEPFIS